MWKPIILDVECIVCNKSLHKISHDPQEGKRKMGKIAKTRSHTPSRRSRTPNWSLEEKQYLLELIKERKELVINKTTNGPHHYEEKDVAWREILRELVDKFGNKFCGSSIKKVKTQWQNMKRIAREEITLHGPEVSKYTRQSMEVCIILDLVKDGVLKMEANLNNTTMSNVEVKAERIDEDVNQPGCSGINNLMVTDPPSSNIVTQNKCQAAVPMEPSTSSMSEQVSDLTPNYFDTQEERTDNNINNKDNGTVNTEDSDFEELPTFNPFARDLQQFFRYTSAEKQLKMESLKEERQVVRAMRETAELNKIIAEQRLKHVLWVKKREMAMYSGEPGSGAGKGGGGGGAIREAGGTFGKMEAAREDEYFYKKQKEQLADLKGHIDKEISFHQEQIKRHEDAIRRHKDTIANVDQNK